MNFTEKKNIALSELRYIREKLDVFYDDIHHILSPLKNEIENETLSEHEEKEYNEKLEKISDISIKVSSILKATKLDVNADTPFDLFEKIIAGCKELKELFGELEHLHSKNDFVPMRNGIATNELVKTPSKKRLQDHFDALTGIAVFKGTQHNFLATFENFSEIKGLRNSTKKLLDALMIKFTDGSSKNLIVNLPLAEYMKMRDLKDEKEARKQVKEDLETLSNTTLTFTQEIKGKAKDFVNLKIIGTHGIKNGIISAGFDVAFHALILNYQVMPMPLAFLAFNDKRSPNAYPLGRRIVVHKNINRVNMTGNEDIISVRTLLEACLDIPTKEELSQTTRHYKDKIIKPFEDGMDELEEKGLFSWEYCHSKGEPLTESELKKLKYETFINLFVKITWNNYPDNLIKKEKIYKLI